MAIGDSIETRIRYANQLKRQLAVDDSKQLASDEIEKRRPIIQAPKKEYKSR